MKTKYKNILKVTIFLLIFCILLYNIFNILWLENHNIENFYDEPKDTLDIIYIGASTVHHSFNAALAYNLYGYTTNILSSSTQPFSAAKHLMKEAEKYQNPVLYILDIGRVAEDLNARRSNIRQVTDAMKWSDNRTNAINEMLSYTDVDKKDYINYKYSFLLYHNAWRSLKVTNFEKNNDLYKGYIPSPNVSEEEIYCDWDTTDTMELDEKNEANLNDIMEYIKSNNINVLFIVPIKEYKEEIKKKTNSAIEILESNGFNVINIGKIKEIGIDGSKDFFDKDHLNVEGGTKFTLYLAKYLKEHYNLPDHRGDSNYSSWDSEYIRLKELYKEMTKNDFDELLEKYSKIEQ